MDWQVSEKADTTFVSWSEEAIVQEYLETNRIHFLDYTKAAWITNVIKFFSTLLFSPSPWLCFIQYLLLIHKTTQRLHSLIHIHLHIRCFKTLFSSTIHSTIHTFSILLLQYMIQNIFSLCVIYSDIETVHYNVSL